MKMTVPILDLISGEQKSIWNAGCSRSELKPLLKGMSVLNQKRRGERFKMSERSDQNENLLVFYDVHIHCICICLSSEQGSRHPECYAMQNKTILTKCLRQKLSSHLRREFQSKAFRDALCLEPNIFYQIRLNIRMKLKAMDQSTSPDDVSFVCLDTYRLSLVGCRHFAVASSFSTQEEKGPIPLPSLLLLIESLMPFV